MQKIIKGILLLNLTVLSACSLLYLNAVRHEVVLQQGEPRSDVISRFGEPIHSSKNSDTFSIRGRRSGANDTNEVAGAMTAFTLGLGEIIVFPYILVSESYGAVMDHFCVISTYDGNDYVIGYEVLNDC